MTRRRRFLSLIACGPGAVALALCVLTSAAMAQQSNPPANPVVLPPENPMAHSVDIGMRQSALRNAEFRARNAEFLAKTETFRQKRIELVLAQMKEDFRRIQIVRNDVARNVRADSPFDYAVISLETAEINSRAERLWAALLPTAAPRDKGKSQDGDTEFSDGEMKGALAGLCHLIDSFVENPALKNPRAVDRELSKKLVMDLFNIVDLSGNLKRSADKLENKPK